MSGVDLAADAVRWYERHARDLPWRAAGVDAWGVLVSEVMLQQTPAARVVPVWQEWLRRWPAPAALGAEPVSAAIRAWGRLGYPRRAMRLHACAAALVDRHSGRVPDDIADLVALPGVGTYTAHAVAAFAYRRRCPVVDTNVRRFVARCAAGAPDAGAVTTAADLAAAEALLPAAAAAAARASAAFMELGAVVCTARQPACGACPVARHCAWRRRGQPLPPGPTRRPQRYAGTDRQVRGRILALLREADGPLAQATIAGVWGDGEQRGRALASLLADGLVTAPRPGYLALPD